MQAPETEGLFGDLMADNKRYNSIADMKSMSLLGVILGHCLLFYVGNPFFPESAGFVSKTAVWITTFFDAALVPGFLFCSGFLLANSIAGKGQTVGKLLVKKSRQLILTYYLFGIFWVVPLDRLLDIKSFGRPQDASLAEEYKYMLLGVHTDHLWFLWLLFWVSVLFILLKPLVTKKRLPLLFAAVMAAAVPVQLFLQDVSYFKISQVPAFVPVFFAGVCIYFFFDRIEKLPWWVLLGLTAVFFAAAMFHGKALTVHFSLVWLCKICGALTSFFAFVLIERSAKVKRFRQLRPVRFAEYHGMYIFLFNCPPVYLFFKLLSPYIGKYAALCVICNFILTTAATVILEIIRSGAKKRVKELIGHNE